MHETDTPATPEEAAPHIARIDRLTDAGRVNWFGLMAYLVFAFITVLGVEDADFFIPSRQTQLPLINVAIPTEAFFYFAPVLGVALYVYLHLYVRKATAALTAAPARGEGVSGGDPTPLERHLKPWLLNDMVLRWRNVGAIEARPMDLLATLTALSLIWIAGPFVLGAMWVRTWPAHDQWMTVLTGLCLALSIYAGHLSWVRMRRDIRKNPALVEASDISRDLVAVFAAMMILNLGWTKTESGGLPFEGQRQARIATNLANSDWWSTLAPAQLAEVQFSVLPPEQNDPTAARHSFRTDWCARQGLDADTCGRATYSGIAALPALPRLRDAWCEARDIASGKDCVQKFTDLETQFDDEWSKLRSATRAALPKPDLRNADLRGSDLNSASLTGVLLSGARLDGAVLSGAQMEGADLSGAQIEGAVLSGAQMEGADLSFAQMEGADLSFAQMEGADLSGAQMEGAVLRLAQMEGADLSFAQMEGAVLSGAQMEGADLSGAQMEGADLWRAQMEGADLSFAQMEGAVLSGAQMEGAVLSGAQAQSAS